MESYFFSKVLNKDFDDAKALVTERLKSEGFGVLTEIDVQSTLKNKLDVDFKRYTILGACNPQFAHKALLAEDNIGTMLPCNVLVKDAGEGKTEVVAVNPIASMQAVGNADLKDIAETVKSLLSKIIEGL